MISLPIGSPLGSEFCGTHVMIHEVKSNNKPSPNKALWNIMKLGMPVCPFGWDDVYDDPHSMINGMVSDVYGVQKWPDQCRDVWQNHHWTSAQITTGKIEDKFDSWVSDKSIWSTWHAYILYDIWCMINDTWIYIIYIYWYWYMIYDRAMKWTCLPCHIFLANILAIHNRKGCT